MKLNDPVLFYTSLQRIALIRQPPLAVMKLVKEDFERILSLGEEFRG